MKIPFDQFIQQLKDTNLTLEDLTDFSKVSRNVKKIEIKLTQLNYLLGKSDLHVAIKELFEDNPSTFDVLDILLAVRKSHHKKVIAQQLEAIPLETYFASYEGICEYVDRTGLAEVFRSSRITNLVSYVFGVEVGLDTNARKNRSGQSMERTIATFLRANGIPFRQEVYLSEFPEITSFGTDRKRFDFVIKTHQKTYLIEVNFYNGGGSKLNEVARAYMELASKFEGYNKYEFVWITDGRGWLGAKNKLSEAYKFIPHIYNLTTLLGFVETLKNETLLPCD